MIRPGDSNNLKKVCLSAMAFPLLLLLQLPQPPHLRLSRNIFSFIQSRLSSGKYHHNLMQLIFALQQGKTNWLRNERSLLLTGLGKSKKKLIIWEND